MPNVNINEIMADLDMETIAQRFGIAMQINREKYQPYTYLPQTYEEFMRIMTDFYENQWIGRLNLKNPVKMPEDYVHGYVWELLNRCFGEGGVEYAYTIAKTGVEGGLKAVLDKMYQSLYNEFEEHYISYIINKALGLSWESKVELMRQYVKKFSGQLPDGTSIKDPYQLATRCEEMIKNHVKLISHIKVRLSRI